MNFLILWLVGISAQKPGFTKTPPPVQYVLQGNTATFDWDYDGGKYHLSYGTWKRTDSASICIDKARFNPPRVYCGPKFKLQGRASMVIRNVTSSMSGEYVCTLALILSFGTPPRSFVSYAILRVISK